MKKPGKLILCALLACGVVCSLAACGGEAPQQPADTTAVSSAADAGTTSQPVEEAGPVVHENFTSGVLYENGEYYFAVDSIERTDEGVVITYRADSDLDGRHFRRAELESPIKLNGVTIACMQNINEKMFRMEVDGEEHTQSEPFITGREDTAQMVIPEELLEALKIEGVPTITLGVKVGSVRQDSMNDFRTGAVFEAVLAPGSVVDEVAFPTPENKSWVLLDDEEFGKAQIVYLREDKVRGSVEGYVLTAPGTTEETGVRMDCPNLIWKSIWQPNKGQPMSLAFFEYSIGKETDSPTYYKPTVELKLSNNGGMDELKVLKHTFDFTGLKPVK